MHEKLMDIRIAQLNISIFKRDGHIEVKLLVAKKQNKKQKKKKKKKKTRGFWYIKGALDK